MKVLFITNIPTPYRVEFFELLGKKCDLTVIFEAKKVEGISFNYNYDVKGFKAVFLSNESIQEKKINFNILKYITNDYDYVFATNYSYYTEILALLKLKLLHIPYNLEIDGVIYKKEHFFKYLIKRLLIRGATAYFSPSKFSDSYLLKYIDKNAEIVRYPFTSLTFDDIEQNKKNIKKGINFKNNKQKVILYVGQFIERKGIDTLIDAFNQIDNDNYSLVLIGAYSKHLDYYNSLPIKNNKNIYCIDFLKKDELNKYYQQADLFVLPSREEVWGLVVNEAMSFGVPVITTNTCSAGVELIEDGVNGYLFEPENSLDLAQKIKLIFEKDDISKIKNNNLIKIQNYTINRMVDVHLNYMRGIK